MWEKIRDGASTVLLLLWYPVFLVAGIVWRLAKLLVLIAVVYGAVRQVGAALPTEWPAVSFSVAGAWELLSTAVVALSEAWVWLALAVVFLHAWQTGRAIEALGRHTQAVLMTVVALGNYLEIEIETDATKQMREKGPVTLMKQGLGYRLASFIFGRWLGDEAADYAGVYSARPVRHGNVVTFWEDMRKKSTQPPTSHEAATSSRGR